MQDGKHVILCIDDDPDVRFFLKSVLEKNDYVFAEAETAEEGLGVFEDVKPDAVIVDLMMEEVDAGTGFVKDVKAKGSNVPIYMLSSVGDNLNLSADYNQLGLSGVFQKPISTERLLKVLDTKLKK